MQPINPMQYASSFSELADPDTTDVRHPLERRLGMTAAVALGSFGLAIAVVAYLFRAEIWQATSILSQTFLWMMGLFMGRA
ncbi:MAG: hypothetical protein JWM86_1635 [Thermoleophilia bacterium]|nr:hypothetical protein [Thermoleophilia bacterium]